MTVTDRPAPDAPAIDEAAIGAFAERMAMAAIGAFELVTVELGMRLGLYTALAEAPATPPELAERAGIDARYAREWLEQQATAGIVAICADPLDGDPDRRLFALSLEVQACLLDPDSLACVAPLATFATSGALVMDELVDAYRTGGGISFGGYGPWIRQATAAFNRPHFVNLLVADWLPALPDVVARLEAGGARVADIGCGSGWSAIALARGFADVTVDGLDSDEASIADARANAEAAGVADRVRFTAQRSSEARAADVGAYDLVCCFEALHDMAHPVEALTEMRRLAGPDGAVLIADERTADALSADDPDPMQHLFYAASVIHCLPVGRSEEGSAATGTVLRTAQLERYAADAGFASVEVLAIEHPSFRFYRLHP
jgi:2-polyprenyl-3-methyl-5-hydroxy-6-metoxy-1,4-benzoquinol methylase